MGSKKSFIPRLTLKGGRAKRTRWVASMGIMLVSFVLSLHPGGVAEASGAGTAPATATTPAVVAGKSEGIIEALLLQLPEADGAKRKEILEQLAQTGDQRLDAVFTDFSEGSLYLWQGKVVTCKRMDTEGEAKIAPLINPLTRKPIEVDGKPLRVPAGEIKDITATRRDRTVVRDVVSLLRLSNPDRDGRLAAVVKLGEGAAEGNLLPLQAVEKTEKDAGVLRAVRESIALIQLSKTGTDDQARATRLAAARTLGDMGSARALERIKEIRKAETDPNTIRAYTGVVMRIEQWQSVVEWIGVLFSGLSASSILILMALGLSIIFGLMGVINMAHGELMMIGAYATYITQQAFVKFLPAGAFDWYFLAAIPVSFIVAGIAGMIMEAAIIRFLYGRPLETLLATFGVGYILVQVVRITFGDNIGVNSPTWLRGSWEVVQDVRLPYNRMFIIGFCIGCIGLMYFIIERTRLGLLLRATTQNRTMAASLGVSTRRIDMLTFGLGAGLAGMAGCAITQVGGVTPDMGSNYIIDSFLVVVTGGVGKLAGAIWAGLGLGSINKFLEPEFGTVWAKVIILIMVVLFIQWKPSGLFPAKGRLADA